MQPNKLPSVGLRLPLRRCNQHMSSKLILPANPTDAIWREYPGLSYPTGLDPDAVSLASIFSHYTNLTGGSTGHHLPVSCASKLCGKGQKDGLNAAVSGSTARSLQEQVTGKSWNAGIELRYRLAYTAHQGAGCWGGRLEVCQYRHRGK